MKLKLNQLTSILFAGLLASCGGATADDQELTEGTGGTSVGSTSGFGSSTSQGGAIGVGGTGGTGSVFGLGGIGGTGSVFGLGGATSATCLYNGIVHVAGTVFPSGDSCNTCSCSGGGLVMCTMMACPVGCQYNGVYLAPGEYVPAGDGCNTCMCDSASATGTAAVSCTKTACVGSCSYAGKMYPNGASFQSTDGCNSCSCSNSNVLCTAKACVCNPATEYWRDYVSTSIAQCGLIDYGCPANTTSFGNACGCGCEQSRDCPQSFPCIADTVAVYTSGVGGAAASGGAMTTATGANYMPLPTGGTSSGAMAASGGTSSKTAVDIAPVGGATAVGGQSGATLPVILCATAAQLAQCPLTEAPMLL